MPRHLLALATHTAAILVGLLLLTWPFTFGAQPRVECRGLEMRPGDVCHKAELDGSDAGKVQTYEQRLATARAANPVIAGLGAVVTGFGGYLLVSDARARTGRRTDAGD